MPLAHSLRVSRIGYLMLLVQNCEDKFNQIAASPRFNFIGNIEIGKDLSLLSLRDNYNAMLFAHGASRDRRLGIPGEGLKGVYSARDFVGWYNGLPALASLDPDLTSGDEAVVIGQGNVALDVARTLLTSVDTLRSTDMTEDALASLAKSRIKRVHVVGRRGPMQVRTHSLTQTIARLTFKGRFHHQRSPRTFQLTISVIRCNRRLAPQ